MQVNRAEAELELLRQIALRSEGAFSRLYDRYCRLLYGLIRAIVREPAEAEEVLQETFLQIWRQASAYEPCKGSVYRWLVTLARSRAIDRTRARSFTQRRDLERDLDRSHLELRSTGASQLDSVLAEERAGVVRDALSRISESQRQVMHLAYFGGCTQSEISRKLEIPLGTVKTRMRQALMTLQGLLVKEVEL